MDVDDLPAAGGSRPDRLAEVRPQERVKRHTVEQIIPAPMLDVPVPLMEEQLLVDAFAPHVIQVPEQVIEVPKILIDELSVQTPVREPQLAEQLVEAPSIVSLIDVIRQPVEQIVDIPVPRGDMRCLRGVHPEQGSTALPIEQIVDIPVPHCESPQGLFPGGCSAASSSSSHVPAGAVDEPFHGVFRTFLRRKSAKIPRTNGRNWVRTSTHGLRELSWLGRRWLWH